MGVTCCTDGSPPHRPRLIRSSDQRSGGDDDMHDEHHHHLRHDDNNMARDSTVGNPLDSRMIQSDFTFNKNVLPGGGGGGGVATAGGVPAVTTMRPPPPPPPPPTPPPLLRVEEVSESSNCPSPPPEPLQHFDPLASMTSAAMAATNPTEVTVSSVSAALTAPQQQPDAAELTELSNAGSTGISRSMRRTGSIATSIAVDPPLFSYISNIGAFSTSTYADSSGKHSTTLGLAESAIQRHMNAILNPHASVGSVSSGAAPSVAAGFATAGIQRKTSDAGGEASGAKNSHVSLTDEWKSTERDVFEDAE